MSADARVARAIQQIRSLEASRPEWLAGDGSWVASYVTAVDELVDEAKDALHLTDDDIAKN